jgi:tetratricopeptide (TPR) repeat protein
VREADALNAVGWHTARLGDYDTARDHCQAALALHRRHHNTEGEAATLDTLGWIDHHTGHHHRAIARHREALTVFRALGDTAVAADVLDHLGHPHAALDQAAQAHAAWQEALELYQKLGRANDAERVRRQLDAAGARSGFASPSPPVDRDPSVHSEVSPPTEALD